MLWIEEERFQNYDSALKAFLSDKRWREQMPWRDEDEEVDVADEDSAYIFSRPLLFCANDCGHRVTSKNEVLCWSCRADGLNAKATNVMHKYYWRQRVTRVLAARLVEITRRDSHEAYTLRLSG